MEKRNVPDLGDAETCGDVFSLIHWMWAQGVRVGYLSHLNTDNTADDYRRAVCYCRSTSAWIFPGPSRNHEECIAPLDNAILVPGVRLI